MVQEFLNHKDDLGKYLIQFSNYLHSIQRSLSDFLTRSLGDNTFCEGRVSVVPTLYPPMNRTYSLSHSTSGIVFVNK